MPIQELQSTSPVCGQEACSNPAAFRYDWPGSPNQFICGSCVNGLRNIAGAMGMPVRLLPIAHAELQEEIMRWHREIFSGRRPLATAKKLLEEASECHVAAKGEPINWAAVIEEAADTAIICYVLAGMADADLEAAMRSKLAILVARGSEQKQRDQERGI